MNNITRDAPTVNLFSSHHIFLSYSSYRGEY